MSRLFIALTDILGSEVLIKVEEIATIIKDLAPYTSFNGNYEFGSRVILKCGKDIRVEEDYEKIKYFLREEYNVLVKKV